MLGFPKHNRLLEDSPAIAEKKREAREMFRVGQAVSFCHKDRDVVGTVVRVNQKTISVITDNGHRWRVYYGWARENVDIL